MRILVLSDFYPPYNSGGHHFQCKAVADGLSKKGHEIFVLTSKCGIKRNEDNIFRSLHFLIGGYRGIKGICWQIKMAFTGRINFIITKKIIKQTNPEIVYVGYIGTVSVFPIKAVQRLKIPIVYHLGSNLFVRYTRDCILEQNLFKRFWRKFFYGFYSLKEFDFNNIITISEALKKEHIEVGFSESNISVIPRGISSELINNNDREVATFNEKKIRLLYAGRIIEKKGIHIAISSVGYLINSLGVKDIIFDIIGEGSSDYIKKLKMLISNLKIENKVEFKGKVTHDRLLKLYKDYDFLLFPSIFQEPSGVVLIEAMSQGLPIVATNTGGIPELITHRVNGLLVPPEDSKKMAEAVKRLIDNQFLAQKISNNGIEIIREKFSEDKIIGLIDDYLKKKAHKH